MRQIEAGPASVPFPVALFKPSPRVDNLPKTTGPATIPHRYLPENPAVRVVKGEELVDTMSPSEIRVSHRQEIEATRSMMWSPSIERFLKLHLVAHSSRVVAQAFANDCGDRETTVETLRLRIS